MKQLLIFLMVGFIYSPSDMEEMDGSSFDFWLGDWELSWKDPSGGTGKGTNKIVTILDGKVIQEHFVATEGQYKGMKGTSISVFNPNQKSWHQTWQDNQGGNIVLTGREEDGKKYFETKMNNEKQSRMVFYDFTEEGFTWDWESTQDGGKTWNLNWQIFYTKAD